MHLLLLSVIAGSLALAQGLVVNLDDRYIYTNQGSALVTPTQRQYQTQDVFGQYAYGYVEPHSSKQEIHSLDGVTRGTYSYRDALGKLQTVDYTADANGFHVAATNLPREFRAPSAPAADARSASNIASTAAAAAAATDISTGAAGAVANNRADTVEVAAARQSHLAAHEAARLRLAAGQQQQQPQSRLDLPVPVTDTAEVAAAKSVHLKRVASEALRNELLSGRSVPVARTAHVVVPVQSIYGIPRYYSSGFYY